MATSSIIEEPCARPLDNLWELFCWRPGYLPDDDLCCSTVLLNQASNTSKAKRSRLLVCHDLAGGYQEDKLVQGTDELFYYESFWHHIDVFVYFSHHFITLPPPGWVNTAHRHGVPVLGTFITEWERGALMCAGLFASRLVAAQTARKLARMAAHYGFDGWLINIENPVLSLLLPNVIHFLRVLKAQLHKLLGPDCGALVWYDAVTMQGKLEWQNTVNALNQSFFDACDAIFINYTWTADTPAQIAATTSSARQPDVYMGVDVFGRNTYGGGGMHCNVALAAAAAHGLSAAVFAPGWVYEVGGPEGWRQRQQAFWDAIARAWGPARPVIVRLPFASSFCGAAGAALYRQGEAVSTRPWYHLSRQEAQPLFQHRSAVKLHLDLLGPGGITSGQQRKLRVILSFLEATLHIAPCDFPPSAEDSAASMTPWNGGSCLQLQGCVQPGEVLSVELYRADLLIPTQGLCVTMQVAASWGCRVQPVLHVQDSAGKPSSIALQEGDLEGQSGSRDGAASAASRTQRQFLCSHLAGQRVTGLRLACSAQGGGCFSAVVGQLAVTDPGWRAQQSAVKDLRTSGILFMPVRAAPSSALRLHPRPVPTTVSSLRVAWTEMAPGTRLRVVRPLELGSMHGVVGTSAGGRLSCSLLWDQAVAGQFDVWTGQVVPDSSDSGGSTGGSSLGQRGREAPPVCRYVQVEVPDRFGKPSKVDCVLSWLGSALCNRYKVTELPILEGAAAVVLAVASVDETGWCETPLDFVVLVPMHLG